MNEFEGHDIDATQDSRRSRQRRPVVRLDARALWGRLDMLNRSQGWLAREVGISPGYMSMLVNQKRTPSGRVRRRMQMALGVEDCRELFTREDPNDE